MTAAAEQPPDAPPRPAELPPGTSSSAGATPPPAGGDKPPRERSGAQKRKRAKAKGAPRPASAGAALNSELRKLEEQLTALLVTPALAMHMSEDHWPAEHIEQRSPELAHQVVELARRQPAFRAQLQRWLGVNENAQLAFAAAAYLIPVLIYYGVVPAPPMIKEQLKVPDRGAARAGVMEDWQPPVSSADASAQARPGAFTEQPPGTPGSPPAAAPGAASPSG